MQVKFLFISALVLALGIQSANAQVKQNARNQQARIKQGVKSGELTRAETRNIIRKEKEVKQEVQQAKADGVITSAEKKEIRQDQKKASRTIYRKKHNNRDRN